MASLRFIVDVEVPDGTLSDTTPLMDAATLLIPELFRVIETETDFSMEVLNIDVEKLRD